MSVYYLDASALVKRYADESGSAWIRQITAPDSQNTVLLAEITLAEVAAALAAKSRAPQGITQEQRDRALSLFLQDCDTHFLLLLVDRQVIEQAVNLTQNHRLRGYDSVQLAAAMVAHRTLESESLSAPVFIASDNDLIAAARVEGLAADNPVDYA